MANTGTDNLTFDLVSVLYHALQAADVNERYCRDAQGDQETMQFFREVQEQDRRRAERAKQLLGSRMGGSAGMKAAAGNKPST
jgi:hypothetical protein